LPTADCSNAPATTLTSESHAPIPHTPSMTSAVSEGVSEGGSRGQQGSTLRADVRESSGCASGDASHAHAEELRTRRSHWASFSHR
jgi:hypothetical protein